MSAMRLKRRQEKRRNLKGEALKKEEREHGSTWQKEGAWNTRS
jgi:hypothetical protein